MSRRILITVPAAITCLGLSLAQPPREPPRSIFAPVDTSRLLGSPDPYRAEIAFPKLQFRRPLRILHAGDGTDRLFVVDQEGTIHVFPNRADVTPEQATVFLDLKARISRAGNEEGLLGLAFHPKYSTNGEFFVYYSVARPRRASVIARFRVSKDANRADPNSEEEVLRIDQPFDNHNGGSMDFGPDGLLYIGLGDGGQANDPLKAGQNLETLLGKILRIDIDRKDDGRAYAIPRDNPFVGQGRARGEIWALGLRNVWQMAFDRPTGRLWAADVGQDLYEEVNLIVKGGNYGWCVREGLHSFDEKAVRGPGPLLDPIVEYPHSEGRSITGGVVYRGRELTGLAGAYLYGDFVTGNLWALHYDGQKVVRNDKIAQTGLAIAGFGLDRHGEAYFGAFDGRVYRLREVVLPDQAKPFPRRLSETGLFASLPDRRPIVGGIPYTVNVPFWSDHAEKERFIALPHKGQVGFSPSGAWTFPVGTVFVKSFLFGTKPIETRLLVHAPTGWRGYSYQWKDDGSDAELLDHVATRSYDVKTSEGNSSRSWYFPSRSDCFACHTKTSGFVLGFQTRQLNGPGPDGENQLRTFDRLGMWSAPLAKPPNEYEAFPRWTDRAASRTALARAWLDVNCATCHAPGGTGNAKADLRFHTPLEKAFVVGQKASRSIGSGVVIEPGQPWKSELLHRVGVRGKHQMPPLATSAVDWEAVKILGEWIESLPTKPSP